MIHMHLLVLFVVVFVLFFLFYVHPIVLFHYKMYDFCRLLDFINQIVCMAKQCPLK